MTAYNSASDEERLRMVEGLGKGAGLVILAVPKADAFVFSQAQIQRILSNYLGLEGAISIPHTDHCGGGAVRVLTEGSCWARRIGYLGSSPDPGCQFPASASPNNTGERSKIILLNEYDRSNL